MSAERTTARATAPAGGLARLAAPNGLELVTQMAHDFRSPLTSILALSDSLAAGGAGPVNETQCEQLRLVYTAALHLCNTATDVVELARGPVRALGAGEPFSIAGLFAAVGAMTRPLRTRPDVELRFASPAADRRIGHPTALTRVLLNLVTNALKVTMHGFVAVEACEVGSDRSRVVWSVSDTGPGLTVEGQRMLYRPFTGSGAGDAADAADAGEAAVASFSSAGLGLAVCRKLVASMDATLHVESQPGQGTRFHFEIDAPRADG